MTRKPTRKELKKRTRKVRKDSLKSKPTEMVLWRSEEKYRQLFNAASDAIMVFDAKTRQILDVNEACLKLHGYTKKEFLNLTHTQITAEPEKSEKAIQQVIDGKITRVPLRYHKKKDGTKFPVETSAGKMKLGDQTVIFGLMRDISERKQKEKELNESEIKHKTLIQNIPGMVYRAYPDWSADIISGCKKICGYTKKEFNSKEDSWLDMIHPDDKDGIVREGAELSKKQKDLVQTYRIIDKEGNIRWVEDRKISIFSGEGEFIGIDGIVFDITDKKKLEGKIKKEKDAREQRVRQALKESEAKYLQLFNTVPAAIMLYDAETKELLDGNDAAFNLYGYSREEFLNLTYWDITAEPEKTKKTIPRVLSGEVKRIPLRYQKRKNGSIFPLEGAVGVFKLNNRKVICGVTTDISEYLQIQKELKKTNQDLWNEVENHKKTEMALASRTEHLKEVNAALRVLVQKREEDRKLLEDRVLDNVKTRVMPYLAKVKKSKVNEKTKFQLQIIESALEEVVSPFVNTLSTRYLKLTPTEIQVAILIKEGNSTKDIAYMMGVSPSTIDTHRNKVRKKLGIVNKRENLRTRLLTLQ